MPPKYKLHSVPNDGSKVICAFFNSPEGCRQGKTCRFAHETVGKDKVPDIIEVRSVISSESESEEDSRNAPGKSNHNSLQEQPNMDMTGNAGDGKKKKRNRRGKRPDDYLPFAVPSSKKAKIVTESGDSIGNDKNILHGQRNPIEMQAKNPKLSSVSIKNPPSGSAKTPKVPATNNRPPKQNDKSCVVIDLKLPIAPFSVKPKEPASTPTKTEDEDIDSSSIEREQKTGMDVSSLPLPKSHPMGRKWLDTVEKTRNHPKFVSEFNFDKKKIRDVEQGICAPSGWIKAKPYGNWCAKAPQCLAIDCEMCETEDPVTRKKNHRALSRVSIVDADTKAVLLDTLVKPAWPVTDYRTWVNGIKKEDLEHVEFTLRHAQAWLMAHCSEETVIIGHSVSNDLAAMQMEHYCVVDSAFLFHASDNPTATVSLKDLAISVLGKEMPKIHDSVGDAETSLLCLEHYLRKGGDVELITRTPSNKRERNGMSFSDRASRLFVHRIPKYLTEDHLKLLFLHHANVQPTEVDTIEYTEQFGKTHVVFQSRRHAEIAFDFLEGSRPELESSGRLQKRVYLKDQSHIKVRKDVVEKASSNSANALVTSPRT